MKLFDKITFFLFLQSDLNRHLEELSNQVKETVSDICSQLLLTNQSDALSQVRAIMGVWTTYGTIGTTGKLGSLSDNLYVWVHHIKLR